MDFKQLTGSAKALSSLVSDALLLVMTPDVLDKKAQAAIDPALRLIIADAVKSGDLALKEGRTLYVHRPNGFSVQRLLLTVAGSDSVKSFKGALKDALAVLKSKGAKHITVASTHQLHSAHAESLVTAAQDVHYVYRHTKPSAPKEPTWQRFSLLCSKEESKAVEQGLKLGQAISAGVILARECANLPGNHCTPTHLANQAKALGKQHGLKVQVLDKKAVEKLGMGAFLAVSKGSDEPLQFIVMQYEGAPAAGKTRQAPIVLVGKGITFDSGGISIKPAADMDEMKFDMGGAASVLGTMASIASMKAKLNLVCIIPACENMPDGRSLKPGDVITTMSGKTVEILNTDAEGRLILCDALTYAERFKPKLVVDIATLTGACVVALGHHHSGLFTTDEKLASDMLSAGQASLDPCWRLPMDDEYDSALKSNFADMANVGPRMGGAITAAMFLKRYTGAYRWAHLDIAGTAWKSGSSKGSTGRPVPLLTHFVLSQQG